MDYRSEASAKSFKDVFAWQEAYNLTLAVYELTKSFPRHEEFGLISQMKRAAVSITSNIAEGFGRRGVKEKDNFYAIAHGSLTELENQLLIALGVGYVSQDLYDTSQERIVKTHRLLYGLRKANKMKGDGK